MTGSPNQSDRTVTRRARRLKWATSQQVGRISELAVLSPIRSGIVAGERRTYEDRLRATIANLAKRHQQGIPNELDRVSSIHFGRMIVIRPDQYLYFSSLDGIRYHRDEDDDQDDGPPEPGTFSSANVPLPSDDFLEVGTVPANERQAPPARPELRSWLLTLVEFDGELKSYMREIAQFIGPGFDRIFENCEHFPGTDDFEKFWIWIRTFQINTDLFYAPYRDLSVVRIRQLEAFKRRFDAFVATVRSPTGTKVRSMDEMFDQFLRDNQQYATGFPAPGGTYPTDDER
jgi:hypothetical protein